METTVKDFIEKLKIHTSMLEEAVSCGKILNEDTVYSASVVCFKDVGWTISTTIDKLDGSKYRLERW